MENISLIKDKINKLEFNLSTKQLEKLELYVELLQKWNNTYNLVGKSTLNNIYTRHILDSLQLLSYLKEEETLLDFGSGAGIPSIVIAICREDLKVTACERIGKKCQFMNQARRLLELDNFCVVQKDVREIDGQFDVITCRAVALIGEIFDLTSSIRARKQRYLLLKGKSFKSELQELSKEGYKDIEYLINDSLVDPESVVLDIKF